MQLRIDLARLTLCRAGKHSSAFFACPLRAQRRFGRRVAGFSRVRPTSTHASDGRARKQVVLTFFQAYFCFLTLNTLALYLASAYLFLSLYQLTLFSLPVSLPNTILIFHSPPLRFGLNGVSGGVSLIFLELGPLACTRPKGERESKLS